MEFILIKSAFFVITSFTFLNSVKILDIPLKFPWLVLFLLCLATWVLWEQIYKKRFEFPMLMGSFLLIQLYADTLGNTFKFYEKFNWYDRLTHFTGGAVIGAFALFILSYFHKKNQWKISLKGLIIFAISLALTLTVFYEFWEYFAYSILDYKLLIIGETDALDDLLFNLIGITTSILLLSLILKKKGYLFPKVNDSKAK